jgi:uncharacterized protein (DUF58 family)
LDVLDPEFLRRLERLTVVARKTLRGVGQGERRSKRHGGTVEFADYRGYTPGDDTRQIDWYAYARLEELYLKLYVQEQDLALHLLIDQSASMGTGTPPKLPYARKAALALAAVGLSAGDRVSLRVFRGGESGPGFGPRRGRTGLARLLRYLAADDGATGQTSLHDAARTFLRARPSPGVVVLLTDLLDPGGYERALELLRYSGFEVHLIHVVAPDEVEPDVDQDLELEDAETGETVMVALNQRAIREYRDAFAAFTGRIDAFCRRHAIGYAMIRTDLPVEELVLDSLRRSGLVR